MLNNRWIWDGTQRVFVKESWITCHLVTWHWTETAFHDSADIFYAFPFLLFNIHTQHFAGKISIMYLCQRRVIAFCHVSADFQIMWRIQMCQILNPIPNPAHFCLSSFFFFLLYRQPHFLRAMWQFSTSHHSVVAAIWQIIMTSFLSGYLIRLLFLCIMVIDGHRRG